MNLGSFIKEYLRLKAEQVHFGKPLDQLNVSFELAILASPIVYLVEYVFEWTYINIGYIAFVTGAICIDWLFGVIKHLMQKDFDLKEMIKGLMLKAGLVVCIGFIFEGMAYLSGSDSIQQQFLEIILRMTVLMYPANSAFDNCYVISGGKFPPSSIMQWKKKFSQNMTLPTKEGFKNEDKENE